MRVGFVTWHGGGNVTPVAALAADLRDHGDSPLVLGPHSLADRFGRVGVEFVGRDADEWDLGVQARDTLAMCAREGVDVAVVDYMLAGSLCGAEASGIPTVALVHTLYGALLDAGHPSPMTMAATVATVNSARRAVGLPAVDRLGDLLDRTALVAVLALADLDFATEGLPDNVRYVGPQLEPATDDDARWSPPPGAGPLVVVSLGTTPMDEAPVVQSVLDALDTLPVRVVATLGDHLDPASFSAGPRTRLARYLPHAAVLPHAAAVVTHGGLGTVHAALAHGIPLVCVPLGREQPDNAAAVDRAGAGVTVAPNDVGDRLAACVSAVLEDPSYGTAARRVAAAIDASRGTLLGELRALA